MIMKILWSTTSVVFCIKRELNSFFDWRKEEKIEFVWEIFFFLCFHDCTSPLWVLNQARIISKSLFDTYASSAILSFLFFSTLSLSLSLFPYTNEYTHKRRQIICLVHPSGKINICSTRGRIEKKKRKEEKKRRRRNRTIATKECVRTYRIVYVWY